MIKAIDKKYCIDNLVQLMPYTDVCHLIVSADEIILLKTGNGVLINKYAQHPSRYLFPFSEKEQNDWNHFTELFEYNKVYLDFRGSVGGFRFDKNYFFKGSERALFLEEPLPVDERNATMDSVELNRTEIEKIFDSDNYDSMYVIDRNGRILLAKNDKDKICIGKSIIPSDEEIIEMELRDRKGNYNIARALNPANDTHENYEKANAKKTIEEIENFKIYGPALLGKYSHMLLTVKDGKFDLKWFRIDFISKDKFKLTTSPIAIIEPTIDDVITYSSNRDIEYTPEPTQPIKSFAEVHTDENQEFATKSVLALMDDMESESKDNETPTEEKGVKRLARIFKKNKNSNN